MLPVDFRDIKSSSEKNEKAGSGNGRFPDYVRRLVDIKQMDFEAAFDQLLTILSLEPQKV